MIAIVTTGYGSEKVMRLQDIAKPSIGTGEILVEVHATSVNPVDWKIRRGQIIAKTGFRPPQILGSDFAGIIVKTGSEISQYKVGDRVWGKVDSFKGGAYAEYIKVKHQHLSLMPENLTFEEAASIPNVGLTAFQGLVHKGKLRSQQNVLINGASGGVGTIALQIAKALSCHVTAVCSEKNEELVRSLGADTVINYKKEKITANLNAYDVFFDCVANQSFFRIAKTLKTRGIFVSTIPSLETLLFDPVLNMVTTKQASAIMVKPNHSDLLSLKEMIQANRIKPVIEHKYRMEDIFQAHRASETNRTVGKIVVNIKT